MFQWPESCFINSPSLACLLHAGANKFTASISSVFARWADNTAPGNPYSLFVSQCRPIEGVSNCHHGTLRLFHVNLNQIGFAVFIEIDRFAWNAFVISPLINETLIQL